MSRPHFASGHKEIEDIAQWQVERRLKRREMTVRYTNGKGEKRFHGGKDLKASQAYPKPFGIALSKARTLHAASVQRQAATFLKAAKCTKRTFDARHRVNKAWLDGARLQSVFNYLSQK